MRAMTHVLHFVGLWNNALQDMIITYSYNLTGDGDSNTVPCSDSEGVNGVYADDESNCSNFTKCCVFEGNCVVAGNNFFLFM